MNRFNAKELDAETGNYYYGARYYDPKWSIWLSVDPLAESFPGWSPYTYVYNNPLNYTDSTGMCPDGDCPEETYIGKTNELPEVVITAKGRSKDRGWTSESHTDYNNTQEQYQKDYPEFAGMSDGEMVDHHEQKYGKEYRAWDRKVQGEYRLSQFLNRFELGFLDNGFADVFVVGGATVAAKGYFSSLSSVKGYGFKGGLTGSSSSMGSLGLNPFSGKSFQQIEKMLQTKGFTKKGLFPLQGEGAYINNHLDLNIILIKEDFIREEDSKDLTLTFIIMVILLMTKSDIFWTVLLKLIKNYEK